MTPRAKSKLDAEYFGWLFKRIGIIVVVSIALVAIGIYFGILT